MQRIDGRSGWHEHLQRLYVITSVKGPAPTALNIRADHGGPAFALLTVVCRAMKTPAALFETPYLKSDLSAESRPDLKPSGPTLPNTNAMGSASFASTDDTPCVAPYSVGSKGPAFLMPVGACDCHMQLFEPIHPLTAQQKCEHTEATADDYRQLQRRLHLQRNVLVQPSSYGSDHHVLLAGLKVLGSAARGVATVHPSTSRAELQALQQAGVVGARVDLFAGHVLNETMLEDVARLIEPLGWHIQLHAHPRQLLRLANRLLALPVTVVIEHYARLNSTLEYSSELAAMLSRMLSTGKVWLKLSAPYLASPDSLAYEDLEIFVRHLAYKHLERLVWGTNWPHVTRPSHGKPDDAVLVNLLERWLFKDEIHHILVDNPVRLYRFDSS